MQQEPTNDTASAGAVYVQTNAAHNEVIAFRRAADGSLDRIESVATGGDGDGSPHLQSQGAVTLTSDGQYLLVTNAASEDVSVFCQCLESCGFGFSIASSASVDR